MAGQRNKSGGDGRSSASSQGAADPFIRLKRVYELSMMLAGDPAQVFDHVVRMIAELLDVKVVCLSEIRDGALHFLSVYVDGETYANSGTCTLNVTPCATVESSKDLRIIDNVAAQFPNAAFLKQHNAFSYCGFPVLDNDGRVVAVTCLLDDRPHDFSAEDQELLRIIGQRIAAEFERKNQAGEREAMLSALRASELQNRLILDNAGDGIVILDADGNIESFNRAAREMFGYDVQDVAGKHASCLFCPASQTEAEPGFAALFERVKNGGLIRTAEILAYYPDGSSFPVELSIAALALPERWVFILIVRDATLRKHYEQKLFLAQAVFENTSEGIFISDTQNRIVSVNKALCAMTGYSQTELLGRSPSIWKSGHHDANFYQGLWQSVLEEGRWQGEIWNRHKNGKAIPMLENINIVRNEAGEPIHYIATLSDITGIKQFEERLFRLAHHDPLTGLANRILLEERLGYALQQAKRYNKLLAVMFIDLDRFKNVNDSFGHSVGDQLLQKVAARISSAVRDTDTVARVGGDEFVVVLSDLQQADLAGIIGQKMLEVLANPLKLADRELTITPSIGIAMYPEDTQTVEGLLKHADAAMYHAKNLGRNNCQFYSPSLGSTVYENLILENALRSAEASQQLSLVFQPQFELAGGRLVGAEVLLRWQHPTYGQVSPAQFIPLAEESGQIGHLGAWVLRQACRQMQSWLERGCDLEKLAVNVSALQIRRGRFDETVAAILAETGLPARYLQLEVTESFIVEAERAIAVLENLRGMGLELAIDDFGTSYSSLKYLKLLPIHCLKIDQSFVRDIEDDPNSLAITRAVIALADSLQLKVVAEGVESERQRDILLAAGCSHAQGYWFGRPVPADVFEGLYLSPAAATSRGAER